MLGNYSRRQAEEKKKGGHLINAIFEGKKGDQPKPTARSRGRVPRSCTPSMGARRKGKSVHALEDLVPEETGERIGGSERLPADVLEERRGVL